MICNCGHTKDIHEFYKIHGKETGGMCEQCSFAPSGRWEKWSNGSMTFSKCTGWKPIENLLYLEYLYDKQHSLR